MNTGQKNMNAGRRHDEDMNTRQKHEHRTKARPHDHVNTGRTREHGTKTWTQDEDITQDEDMITDENMNTGRRTEQTTKTWTHDEDMNTGHRHEHRGKTWTHDEDMNSGRRHEHRPQTWTQDADIYISVLSPGRPCCWLLRGAGNIWQLVAWLQRQTAMRARLIVQISGRRQRGPAVHVQLASRSSRLPVTASALHVERVEQF